MVQEAFFMKPKGREGTSPSIAWEGFVGINPESYDGLKRNEGFIFDGFIGEEIYG